VAPYKGKVLTARVEADGRIKFKGTAYDSLSTAGGAARATIIGLRKDGKFPQTGGWVFWRVERPGGGMVKLAELRDQLASGDERSESAG